ncbi:uncharacterized protein VTP21DRAFT_3588 [Calcarisporiella thermophila]|uniref:uncharacterized protein n=1 Tax=Calcarisporiella thermophila TaxID=911321 RepID=UPI003742D2CF
MHPPITPQRPSSKPNHRITPNKFNDDEAEKRSRRQSALDQRLRRVSNLLHTPGSNGPSPRRPMKPIDVVNPNTPLPSLSREQMYMNFEEWMKMATDNKINATNSWNFALIDYFHEMTFLREGNSINFQKASCTLDGCVKIYTSRVDSVVSETGKLLNGLADSNREERVYDDDEDEDGETERTTRKKASRSENTLVKDFSALTLKKFDLEFAVDPLFKKTSADFDEGGARGLLLNHLGVDRECRIIFDASDAVAEADDEVEEEDDEEEQSKEKELEQVPVLLDMSALVAKLPTNLSELVSREICPSLADFEFSSEDTGDLSMLKHSLQQEVEQAQAAGEDIDDFFDSNEHQPFVPLGLQDDDDDDGEGLGGEGEFDPLDSGLNAVSERDFVMAMTGEQNEVFSYFDTRFTRNWAGPEHWKLHSRVSKDTTKAATGADGDDPPPLEKKRRKEKEVVEIDFINGMDIDEEVLFAPASKSSITLPEFKPDKEPTHLLPDDMHFSSRQLLRLFLKPSFSLQRKLRRPGGPVAEAGWEGDGNGLEMEPDEKFWAADQNENGLLADGVDVFRTDLATADSRDSADALFNDAEDLEDDMIFEDDLADLGDPVISQARKVKPQQINYARMAKRVDVRKLKENLWRELIHDSKTEPTNGDVEPLQDPESTEDADDGTEVAGEQRFSEIVQGLKNRYTANKMRDISVPFCFICLLHLANEKNLKISEAGADGELNELVITQDSF